MAGRIAHEKVYGLAAARALLSVRPDDVLRIAYVHAPRGALRALLRQAAARRIVCEERSDEDLARIAGSVHHEGICLAARPRPVLSEQALVEALFAGRIRSIVALDDVSNPHNVGAIVRTAAFFGVDALLVAAPPDRAVLTPAAVRIAQGGAEHIAIARCAALAPALRRIAAAGIAVIGTDVRHGRPIHEMRWPARAVLVLGSEGRGLSAAVREACTDLVTIPGTGAVESLNVSVAAGVLLALGARRP